MDQKRCCQTMSLLKFSRDLLVPVLSICRLSPISFLSGKGYTADHKSYHLKANCNLSSGSVFAKNNNLPSHFGRWLCEHLLRTLRSGCANNSSIICYLVVTKPRSIRWRTCRSPFFYNIVGSNHGVREFLTLAQQLNRVLVPYFCDLFVNDNITYVKKILQISSMKNYTVRGIRGLTSFNLLLKEVNDSLLVLWSIPSCRF